MITTTRFLKVRNPFSNVQATTKWLATLPLLDVHKSINQLTQSFQSLRHEPSTLLEFTSLEMLHPIVKQLTKQILNTALSQTKSIQTRKSSYQMILNLNQGLLNLFFISYHQTSLVHIHQKAKSLYYVLDHITCMLLTSYQLYFPVPCQLWKQLYQCYIFSQQMECFNLELQELSTEYSHDETIANLFNAAILLSICNPYQLHFQDTLNLYQILKDWSYHLILTRNFDDNFTHIIRLYEDQPPIYKNLLLNAPLTRDCIGLDIRSFIAQLKSTLNTNHMLYNKLSFPVLRSIIRSLSDFSVRATPRNHKAGELIVSIGLTNTFYFLNAKKPIQPHLILSKRTIENFDEEKDTSKIKLKLLQESNHDLNDVHLKKSRYLLHNCSLVNTSLNGYCLSMRSDIAQPLHIGEIIGLKEPEQKNNDWHIGVIRWIKFGINQEIQIGVEVLAFTGIAVGINHPIGRQKRYLKGIILKGHANLYACPTIITHNLPYQKGDTIQIINLLIDTDIELGKCIYESKFYKQFEFKVKQHFTESFMNAILTQES